MKIGANKMIQPTEFENRRQRLFDMMEDGSLLILFSGVSKISSGDETYPFEVNRNFYYLTGIEQEDSILLLVNTAGELKEFLFISPYDPKKERWYGRRLTCAEAEDASGISNVLLTSSFQGKVDGILNPSFQEFGEVKKVYLDLDNEIKIADATSTHDYQKTLGKAYSTLKIDDAYPLITTLRLRKSPREILELQAAIKTTGLGISSVMAMLRPGLREYELADEFHKVINDDNGYQGVSFNTIMASGNHCTCLHYPFPLDTVKEGSLVLMDLGARHNYYCADVTRTVPVAGKFTDEQKQVYEIVLGCNKMVAAMARPGVTIEELQSATVEYLASECLRAGFIKKKEDIINYYFHSVSHFIGLDTHDPYGNVGDKATYKKIPLEAGMVISDEPGLYMEDRGIGVRIEDDLLITDSGSEILSKDIIKETSDIERFFASPKTL
jgi:Xaa-Pro aminopeptidase